jgi:hypothetical protein
MEDKALAGHALISMHVPPPCEIDNDIYHINQPLEQNYFSIDELFEMMQRESSM